MTNHKKLIAELEKQRTLIPCYDEAMDLIDRAATALREQAKTIAELQVFKDNYFKHRPKHDEWRADTFAHCEGEGGDYTQIVDSEDLEYLCDCANKVERGYDEVAELQAANDKLSDNLLGSEMDKQKLEKLIRNLQLAAEGVYDPVAKADELQAENAALKTKLELALDIVEKLGALSMYDKALEGKEGR